MNLYVFLTLCIAALQLAFGLVLLSVVRAPGWRGVWPFSAVAISAGVFTVINVAFSFPTVSDALIVGWMRVNVAIAAVNTAAWIAFAFADDEGRLSSIPRAAFWGAAGTIALGVGLAITGAHLVPGAFIDHVGEESTGRYRLAEASALGVFFGCWCLCVIAMSLWAFVRRTRAEQRTVAGFTVGFVIFCVCALNEMLVLTGIVRWYSLGDIGSLAVVLPVARGIMGRFVDDARQLSALTERLSGEVEARTQERNRAQDALVEAERHAALGRIAAGVGHEINNPLTYLSLSLETVEQWTTSGVAVPADVGDALGSVREASTRIGRVVEGLRLAGRASSGRQERLDPIVLCESALRVAAPQLRHTAEMAQQFDEVPIIDGDEAKLVQVLVNLLTNAALALAAAPPAEGGRILVRTSTTANGDALIAVSDNGPGIPDEHLDRVTEPYFTTRASSGGTGLGLFLAREMVEQHGGTLAIESAPEQGTTVRVVLPPSSVAARPGVASSSENARARSVESAPIAVAPKVILLVDDELRVLNAFSRALADDGRIVAVDSGEDALHAIEQGLEPHVIVCDLMMPGMSGIALQSALRERGSTSADRMLFITGGAVTDEARAFVDRDDVRVLFKPVTSGEIREAVRQLSERAMISIG
jgi:signal transduction histidine kinase/ActR/RegA family two-component response regulator